MSEILSKEQYVAWRTRRATAETVTQEIVGATIEALAEGLRILGSADKLLPKGEPLAMPPKIRPQIKLLIRKGWLG